MRFIISVAVLILFIPGAAFGAATAVVNVPSDGEYSYWFSYKSLNGQDTVTIPQVFEGKKTTVDLPLVKDAVPKSTLYVLNVKTGNEAIIQIQGKPGESHKFVLTAADFDHVRRVRVQARAATNDLPAAAAIVKLTTEGKTSQQRVLDPSASGIVEFTDVPAGTVNITVEFGDGKTQSADVDVSLDRDEIVPTIVFPIAGEIDTIQAAESTDRGATGKAGPSTRKSPQGINFPAAMVGLILLVGILYGAFILMRNRGATARSILARLGVEVQEDQPAVTPAQPAPAVQVDPSICPFCGGRKDPATGACACSVVSAPTMATPPVSAGPRLVATQGPYLGSIYSLEADVVTIGRDESNTIAFTQDNTVSRRHARIQRSGGAFTIYDEGSSNGTFVNGIRVTEQTLKSGDEIQVGNTRVRFEA